MLTHIVCNGSDAHFHFFYIKLFQRACRWKASAATHTSSCPDPIQTQLSTSQLEHSRSEAVCVVGGWGASLPTFAVDCIFCSSPLQKAEKPVTELEIERRVALHPPWRWMCPLYAPCPSLSIVYLSYSPSRLTLCLHVHLFTYIHMHVTGSDLYVRENL